MLAADLIGSMSIDSDFSQVENSAILSAPIETGSVETEPVGIDYSPAGTQGSAAPGDLLLGYTSLTLPDGTPEQLTTVVEFAGKRLTLQLDKSSVFGDNTRFLIQDSEGNLTAIDPGVDRAYIGSVLEHPEFSVGAVLTEQGLVANILRPTQSTISIEPIGNESELGDHRVFIAEMNMEDPMAHDHDGDGIPDHASSEHTADGEHDPGCQCEACCAAVATDVPVTTAPLLSGLNSAETELSSSLNDTPPPGTEIPPVASEASLPPSRVTNVLEYEVGVEIGSKAFFGSYNGNFSAAMTAAESLIANLDARFLQGAGVKHRLGTVIIRTVSATDPLRNSVNDNSNSSLNAFRDYWNSNSAEVGNTHDLAVYHNFWPPSGRAYVGSLGGSNAYALSNGRGATSWADGTAAHEVGHIWNLQHVPSGFNASNDFYESRPRSNGNAAGGADRYVSIMNGSGTHNIGRLSTGEANRVTNLKNSRLSDGDPIFGSDVPQVAPFGWSDSVTAAGSPLSIDVVANDIDANNDVLEALLRDTVSFRGGSISLSAGTGPGGRNELIYTPPAGESGRDFFSYIVRDDTGRSDFGTVYIDMLPTVDLTQTLYQYDVGFGTLQAGYTELPYQTVGDIAWSALPNPKIRSSGGTLFDLTADHLESRNNTTLSHRIANGTWRVTTTSGDFIPHDVMTVRAEGVLAVPAFNSAAGQYVENTFDVEVTDGQLDLEFRDEGGGDANWVLNGLVIEKVEAPVVVDLNADEYRYDLGTSSSPVAPGYTQITGDTTGDIYWNSSVTSQDRSPDPTVDDRLIDFVEGDQNSTLEHTIANGVWHVTASMGDTDTFHDRMAILAEGQAVAADVTSFTGQFAEVSFNVLVEDGSLSLEFQDNGGRGSTWVLNSLVIEQAAESELTSLSVVVDSYTGQAFLRNLTPNSISLAGYGLSAGVGALTPDNWFSLHDQNYDGGAWDEANPTANDLTELNPLTTTVINSGTSIYLGQIIDPTLSMNLQLEYYEANDLQPKPGYVSFESLNVPVLPGDYNGNNVVDLADYTVWRDGLGTTVAAHSGADGNGNGLVDATDLQLWRQNYGKSYTPAVAAFQPSSVLAEVVAVKPATFAYVPAKTQAAFANDSKPQAFASHLRIDEALANQPDLLLLLAKQAAAQQPGDWSADSSPSVDQSTTTNPAAALEQAFAALTSLL